MNCLLFSVFFVAFIMQAFEHCVTKRRGLWQYTRINLELLVALYMVNIRKVYCNVMGNYYV